MSEQAAGSRPAQRQWNRFLLIALAMHIPLFIYPILRLADWLALDWWITLIVLIPLASSQVVTRVYLRLIHTAWSRWYRKISDFWLGLSPILLMSLLLFEVLVLVTPLTPLMAGQCVLGITLTGGVMGFLFAVYPTVKTIRFQSKKLNSPVRFVQITDVHIGSRSRRFLERVVGRINRLNPDFVCITGDFIDATGIEESELQSLKSIVGPVYFCLGNHEKYEDLDLIIQRLRNLGVQVLRSEERMFREDVQVLGIDDMEDPLQVAKELPNIALSDSAFKVLLYHRPRGLEAAAEAGVDLILSGHTHNGQIFPFNLAVGRVFDRIVGMYQLGNARQYVSQGTGTWGPVLRLGTQCEITLFEIEPIRAN